MKGTRPPTPAALGAGRTLPGGRIVLDASFVIALLQSESAATALAPVLARSVMTSVTAGEVFYKLAAGSGTDPTRIETTLTAFGVRIEDLPLAAARHFPDLRALDAARRAEQEATGEPAATLSLADLCVLGHALTTHLPVLTGDRHWTTLTAHGLAVDVINFRDPQLTT